MAAHVKGGHKGRPYPPRDGGTPTRRAMAAPLPAARWRRPYPPRDGGTPTRRAMGAPHPPYAMEVSVGGPPELVRGWGAAGLVGGLRVQEIRFADDLEGAGFRLELLLELPHRAARLDGLSYL